MYFSNIFLLCFAAIYIFTCITANDDGFKREKTHLKKDPRDYTDRDVDSLFEEWEVKLMLFLFIYSLCVYV